MVKTDIKMKFFVKPTYEDNCEDADHYGYGGMYIGEGTEYPIKSINFGHKTVEVYRAPSCAGEVIWGSFLGYGNITDKYSFEELEIVDINFIPTKFSQNQLNKIEEKAQHDNEEQWGKIKSGYYDELRQQKSE